MITCEFDSISGNYFPLFTWIQRRLGMSLNLEFARVYLVDNYLGHRFVSAIMATGDLTNNIRRLQKDLKSIKYNEQLDITGITQGSAPVYLLIYHYAFTTYSPALAQHLSSSCDIDLFGKTDVRFMESIYKVLRDEFHYKPPITKEQFFSNGFAERKIIMCSSIIEMVKAKSQGLQPQKPPSQKRTSAITSHISQSNTPKAATPQQRGMMQWKKTGVSKPKSSELMVSKSTEVLTVGSSSAIGANKTKKPNSASGASLTSRPESIKETQVVNELFTGPFFPPTRHKAIHNTPNADDLRAVKAPQSWGDGEVESSLSGKPNSNDRHHSMQAKTFSTPSVAKVHSTAVEVVTIPRAIPGNDSFIDTVDIHAFASESIMNSTVPCEPKDIYMIQNQISNLYKTMEDLVHRVDSTLDQNKNALPDPYISQLEEQIHKKFDNLSAQLILLNNRVSILESQIQELTFMDHNTRRNFPVAKIKFAEEAEKLNDEGLLENQEKTNGDDTLNKSVQILRSDAIAANFCSPIRYPEGTAYIPHHGKLESANDDTFAMGTEEDARRSSTPTNTDSPAICRSVPDSFSFHFTDADTQEKALRIKQMLQSTAGLLKPSVPTILQSDESKFSTTK
ncbi:hypothetical protein ACJMK2_030788 [Sinanodonta woodiana]|uniref:Centrosomal protein of 44 kDa n=1 Tax=Sinanodonta woodiana TaxID=1069815 RepID=A0ABD3X0B6_SINWO